MMVLWSKSVLQCAHKDASTILCRVTTHRKSRTSSASHHHKPNLLPHPATPSPKLPVTVRGLWVLWSSGRHLRMWFAATALLLTYSEAGEVPPLIPHSLTIFCCVRYT